LRSTNFWILPVDVFGSTPNTTCFGALKCANRARQWSMISPLRRLHALFQFDERTRHFAPILASGLATTAAAITAGWRLQRVFYLNR
jgi:hypothetical protein